MNKLLRQACGQEPESLWMTVAAAAAVFIIPVMLALAAVAFGWGEP